MRHTEASATFVADAGDVVWVAGADALAFLDRMSTNRLADLPPWRGRTTALPTDEGRVVDVVAAHVRGDGVVLRTSAAGAGPEVAAHLRRYVLYGDDARVTDARGQVALFALFGPGAAAAAAGATDLPAADLGPGEWRASPDDRTWLLRHPDPWPEGFDVVAPRGAPCEALAAALAGLGAEPESPEAGARRRIDLGRVVHGAEITGDANPLELGLRAIVDFGKGCYIGQEVVARLDSYDKVQRALVRLEVDGEVEPGAPVVRGAAADGAAGRRSTGRVTSVAPLPDGRTVALAILPKALAEAEGDALIADTPGGKRAARVTDRLSE